jgi:hypothetical protein
MADMFAKASTWIDGKRRDHLSSGVTYKRGAVEAELPAMIAFTSYEMLDERGAIVKAKSIDFVVSVADLAAAGLGDPQIGDLILTGDAAESEYQVLQLPGTHHWEPHDPHGVALRIHTKLGGPCE